MTCSIFLAAMSRLLPHPPNFTPVAAMAFFGGACFTNKKIAFIVPLLIMFISDSVLELISGIGFHNTMLYVYVSFVLITMIGIFIRNNISIRTVILGSLISSMLFFLITNFGVWASLGFVKGLHGLLVVYLTGIPFYSNDIFGSFFLNTIMGDMFYCGTLFVAFYFVKSKFLSRTEIELQ
ncbi:MAG: DUF6580 family putative transport protein [Bacteroidota bacterium]